MFAPRDDYATVDRGPRSRRPWVLGGLVALLVAGLIGALSLSQDGREADERAAAAARIEAKREEIARQQRPKRGRAPALRERAGASRAERLRTRAALVGAVEAAIVRDAQARARSGELDRSPDAARCGPLLKSKTAVRDDRVLDREVGRFDCVAVVADIDDPQGGAEAIGQLGFAFVANADFRTGAYTWCRNTPAQGERGKALVFVRLERACLATKGRALGTGYVAGEDER